MLLYILLFALLMILIYLKVVLKLKIKWKTFLKKGFIPIRGDFGLYCYTGNQGTGKTYSLAEYVYDNKNCFYFTNIKNFKTLNYLDKQTIKMADPPNCAEFPLGDSEGVASENEEALSVDFTQGDGLLLSRRVKSKDTLTSEAKKQKELERDRERTSLSINAIYYDGFNELYDNIKLLDSGYYDELINGRQIIFIYDELFTELQRNTQISLKIQDFLSQLRKRKIKFLTTAQIWSEIPLFFRKMCRYQINCKMISLFITGVLFKEFRDAENMKWDADLQEHVAPTIDLTLTKTRQAVSTSYNTLERIKAKSV